MKELTMKDVTRYELLTFNHNGASAYKNAGVNVFEPIRSFAISYVPKDKHLIETISSKDRKSVFVILENHKVHALYTNNLSTELDPGCLVLEPSEMSEFCGRMTILVEFAAGGFGFWVINTTSQPKEICSFYSPDNPFIDPKNYLSLTHKFLLGNSKFLAVQMIETLKMLNPEPVEEE